MTITAIKNGDYLEVTHRFFLPGNNVERELMEYCPMRKDSSVTNGSRICSVDGYYCNKGPNEKRIGGACPIILGLKKEE